MKNKAEPANNASSTRMSAEAADLVRQALRDEATGLDRMTSARVCILKLFARVDRFSGEIDSAFAGQMFVPHMPPDAPKNIKRAKTYLRLHQETTKLLERAIRLWMLSYGMKPEDDWSPILVEHMRLQYAERKSQSASTLEQGNGCQSRHMTARRKKKNANGEGKDSKKLILRNEPTIFPVCNVSPVRQLATRPTKTSDPDRVSGEGCCI